MELFYGLLILIVLARICGEIAERFGQPELVGELIAGVLVGATVQQFADQVPTLAHLPEDPVFITLTDFGIFFLMLLGGLEIQTKELSKASKESFNIALGGLLLPLALGLGIGYYWLPDSPQKLAQTLFIGTALAITAVPVAIKVLMDLGQLNTRVGQIIVSSAVFDDILGLFLLAIITAVIKQGVFPQGAALVFIALKVILFFIITIGLGHFAFQRLCNRLKSTKIQELEFSLLLVCGLAYAVLAEVLGLHFIMGAFMAGLFFTRQTPDKKTFECVESQLSGLTHGFLGPIFFSSIGLHVDFSAIFAVPDFVFTLILLAILGKLIGSGFIGWYFLRLPPKQALAVGFGMSGRGAIELIIADIALRAGLFESPGKSVPVLEYMYSSIVLMAILTTVITPIALKHFLGSTKTTQLA